MIVCMPDAEFPFGLLVRNKRTVGRKRNQKRQEEGREREKEKERGAIAQTNNKTNLQESPSV